MLVLHLFATFVEYNSAMFLPILTIRTPRLVFRILDVWCLRDKVVGEKMKQTKCCAKSMLFMETTLRLISMMVFFIMSLVIQYTFIFDTFCSRYVWEENEDSCQLDFGLIMTGLIICNTIIDFGCWRACSIKLSEELANAPDIPAGQQAPNSSRTRGMSLSKPAT